MFVRDRMSSPAVTITSDTPFQDALTLMHDHGFRRLPVVDNKGELVGIVTERALLYVSPSRRDRLTVWELKYLLSKLQVKSIMAKDVIATTPDTFIEDAARLMAENKIGALPVVNEDNRVVGVITETDLFKALIEMFAGGRFGLRLTLSVPHERGVVTELCKAVFGLGGSIVSVGSFNGDVFSERGFVIKVQDVHKDQLVDTLEALGDHVIDAHEVEPQHNRKEDVMATRILVPLDGSALAERALPYATMLTRGLSAELVLLRAVCLPSDFNGTLHDVDLKKHRLLEQLEVQACDYLDHIVSRLQGTGLSVQTVVQSEPAAEAIVGCAEQMDIQQIVMGTHGYSGFSRLRHGSVAAHVLQSANAPVLMVCGQRGKERGPHEPEIFRRILVPLDGSRIAEQVLPPAISVAHALDSEIVLFRVSMVSASGSLTGYWYQPLEGSFETADQIAEVYLDRVADRLRVQMIKVSTAVRRGAVADAIVNFAEGNHIDLIAMCTHGQTRVKRWTLGSVAEHVLGARCAPVLLVRAKRTRREMSKADEQDELHTSLAGAAMADAQARH